MGMKVDEVIPEGPVSLLYGDILPPVAAHVALTPLRGPPKKETERDITAVSFSNMYQGDEWWMTRGLSASCRLVWAELKPWVEAVSVLTPVPIALSVV
jgi:hypothetical protein